MKTLAVNYQWTGLLEWTTGLTYFALEIIFMACTAGIRNI